MALFRSARGNRCAAALSALALGVFACSCRRAEAPSTGTLDSAAAACIPPDAVAVVGLDLEKLRSSELYRNLPPGATKSIEPAAGARSLLLAYAGGSVVAVARGPFTVPPAGAVLIGSDLAVMGPPAAIDAAKARLKAGGAAASPLIGRAGPLAAQSDLWAIFQGGVPLPLTGNAANWNRFLRLTQYATVGIRLGPTVQLEARGICGSAEAALELEESFRGFLSLAAVGAMRDPDLRALLRSVEIRREGLNVIAGASASAGNAAKLFTFPGMSSN